LNFRFKIDDLTSNDKSIEMAADTSGIPSSNIDKIDSNTSGLGSFTNKTARSFRKNVDFDEVSIIDLNKSSQEQISKSRFSSTPLIKEARNYDKQAGLSTIPSLIDETSFESAHSSCLKEKQSASRMSTRYSPKNLTSSDTDSDRNSTNTETSSPSMDGESSSKSKYKTRRSKKDNMEKLANYYTPNQSGRVSKRRNYETRYNDSTLDDKDCATQKETLPNEPSGIQIKRTKIMQNSDKESLKDLFKDCKQVSTGGILFEDSYYDQVELIIMPDKGSFRLNVQPSDNQSTNEKPLRDFKKLFDKFM
jgi:hypothetical protein